jgi:hypothetical protein
VPPCSRVLSSTRSIARCLQMFDCTSLTNRDRLKTNEKSLQSPSAETSFGNRKIPIKWFLSLTLPFSSRPLPLPPQKNPARAPQGRGMASVMNFYTDDSPGIKMSPVSLFFFERTFFILSSLTTNDRARRKKNSTPPLSLSHRPFLFAINNRKSTPVARRDDVRRVHRLRDSPPHHRQGEIWMRGREKKRERIRKEAATLTPPPPVPPLFLFAPRFDLSTPY